MPYPSRRGGAGTGTGFTLGPIQNVFTGATRAAAEQARDTYQQANASWLAQYNADTSLNIRLEYIVSGNGVVTYQVRNSAGTSWLDNSSSVGVQGRAGINGTNGVDGLMLEFNSRANLDDFFEAHPDRLINGLPVTVHLGNNIVTTLVWNGPDNPTDYVDDDDRWRESSDVLANNSLYLGDTQVSNAVENILVTTPQGNKVLAVGIRYTDAGSQRLRDIELSAETDLDVNSNANTVLANPFTLIYSTFGDNLTNDFMFIPNEAGQLRVRFYLGTDNTGSLIFDETRTVTQDEVDASAAALAINNIDGAFLTFGVGNPYFLDQGTQIFVEFSGIALRGGEVSGGPFDGQTIIAFRSRVQGFTTHAVARQSELIDAEGVRDISYAGVRGINGITVTVDDDANTLTISGSAPSPVDEEEFFHGLSSSNNPGTVDTSTLTRVDVGMESGQQFDFTIPAADLNDYVILLVPTDNDISTLINTDTGFSVLGSYTRTEDVRSINGVDYTSYTLGPLVAGFTANYRATLA